MNSGSEQVVQEARNYLDNRREPMPHHFALVQAVDELGTENAQLRAEVAAAESFHKVAVSERNFERAKCDRLREEVADAVKMCDSYAEENQRLSDQVLLLKKQRVTYRRALRQLNKAHNVLWKVLNIRLTARREP